MNSTSTTPPLSLPPTDVFLKTVSDIRVGAFEKQTNNLYYFVFSNDDEPVVIVSNTTGRSLYSEDQLVDIAERYTKMIYLINRLVEVGINLRNLSFTHAKGYNGVAFGYFGKKDESIATRYIRTGGAEAFIPDDFLHDLLYIPTRVLGMKVHSGLTY